MHRSSVALLELLQSGLFPATGPLTPGGSRPATPGLLALLDDADEPLSGMAESKGDDASAQYSRRTTLSRGESVLHMAWRRFSTQEGAELSSASSVDPQQDHHRTEAGWDDEDLYDVIDVAGDADDFMDRALATSLDRLRSWTNELPADV